MALNKIVYFPNPALGKVVGTTLSAVAAGTTILTVAASNEYKYVKDFTVTMTGTVPSADENMVCKLKIGTGEFVFGHIVSVFTAAFPRGGSSENMVVFSSKDIGFNGAWLQPGDTIVFTYLVCGATVIQDYVSVSVTVDDYYTA